MNDKNYPSIHSPRIKHSFEQGMQSQVLLFESFKSKNFFSKDDQSIFDDTDSHVSKQHIQSTQKQQKNLQSSSTSKLSLKNSFENQSQYEKAHNDGDFPQNNNDQTLKHSQIEYSSSVSRQQQHQPINASNSKHTQQFNSIVSNPNSSTNQLVLRSSDAVSGGSTFIIPKKKHTLIGIPHYSGQLGIATIEGDVDSPSSRDGDSKFFPNLADSKQLNKKLSALEKELSHQDSQGQIEAVLEHNLQEANQQQQQLPVKAMLNSEEYRSPHSKSLNRRGSRRIVGQSAFGLSNQANMLSSVMNNNGGTAAATSTNQLKGIGGGFFGGFLFAAKMKKYANKLVSRLQSRRYESLRAKHLHYFHDKTIFPDEERGIFKSTSHKIHRANKLLLLNNDVDDISEVEGTEISKSIQKQCILLMRNIDSKYLARPIKALIARIPIFDPSHPAKLLWDLLTMMSISYFLIFFPMRIAFGLEIYFSFIPYTALVILIADTFVLLNTGFYDRGVLVYDRIAILMHYINRRLLADLLTLFPFFFYDIAEPNRILFLDPVKSIESCITVLFLIRLKHLNMNKKKIEERFYEKKALMHIISLCSLLLNTMYIAHLLACVWAIIAQCNIETGDTWMNLVKVDGDEWYVQYMYSLYFLIVTMTTVGYGDIRPQNTAEHIFTIAIVLIGSVVFSFSINQIGTIVQQMAAESERVKSTLQVINNFMTKKNINMSLQQSIREYLEYYLKESLVNDNETEQKIINMLSEPLKRHLMIEANKIALKDSPIFRNNFSDATISKTVSLIEDLRCTPEEVIFYEGDIDNIAIFFVQQGKVEIFIESQQSTGESNITSLKVFSQGSSFGETSFFTGAPRGISIRSIDFTTLLVIKRSAFLEVLKDNSDDYENFCKIKDNISLYQQYEDIGIKCLSCSSQSHFLIDCPLIHYVPDKEKIIKIFQRPIEAERQPSHQRHERIRLNLFNIQAQAYKITNDYINYIEDQEWFDGSAEDEEEYEFYNQYEDEDAAADYNDDKDRDDIIQGGGGDYKNYYKQFEGGTIATVTATQEHNYFFSPHKEDSYIRQSSNTGIHQQHHRQAINGYENQSFNPSSSAAGETHSLKSGVAAQRRNNNQQNNNTGIILEIEDGRRDKVSSNFALHDLQITPSGLLLNLINPNPGNIRENTQQNLVKRKNSSNISIINNNNNNNHTPQIFTKSQTLNAEDQYGFAGVSSGFNNQASAVVTSSPNVNLGPPNSIPIQLSLVRKTSKRKNTERSMRSTQRRKSTKRTIESKIQVGSNSLKVLSAANNNNNNNNNTNTNNGAGGIFERKKGKKLTAFQRKGQQEYQIQNTLLALQGMENIILQNKGSANSNEFDLMKSFEIYFPHNNIDVVLFSLRKKNPHLYSKQKSFLKQTTKKFVGGATNGTSNRMSKMDMVLQKFLQSEIEDDRDKDSVNSNHRKSMTHLSHHRTPRQTYIMNNNHDNHQSSVMMMSRSTHRHAHKYSQEAADSYLEKNLAGNIDSPTPTPHGRKRKAFTLNSPRLIIDTEHNLQENEHFEALTPENGNLIQKERRATELKQVVSVEDFSSPLNLYPETHQKHNSVSSCNISSKQRIVFPD